MRTPSGCAPWLLLLAFGGAVHAAELKCIEEGPAAESPFECLQRLVKVADEAQAKEAKEQAAAEAKDATDEELAGTKTGAETGGTATANTLTDLAPLFDALGLLSSGESTGDQLAFNLNFLIPVQDVENNNAQLQLIVDTQPEPLDLLVQSFDETIRETRNDELQKDISTFGDEELRFNWSLVNTRFGRDYRILRDFIAPLYDGADANAQTGPAGAARRKQIGDFPAVLQAKGVELSMLHSRIATLPADKKDFILAQTLATAAARNEWMDAFRAEVARAQLGKLVELVSQQPQLIVGISHNFRDEIVGPEETRATVTWEMTRRNFSNFIHGKGAVCKQDAVKRGQEVYTECINALSSYLAADFDKQWRVKLSASYKQVEEVSYAYPDDNVTLDIPKTDRIEVTIGAGREFSGKPDLGRLDFELSYDSNVDNNTANKDRLKAAVTLTKRVGDVDVPFSIVYANRNEFLGEVDHQIGMHIGIKFRSTK